MSSLYILGNSHLYGFKDALEAAVSDRNMVYIESPFLANNDDFRNGFSSEAVVAKPDREVYTIDTSDAADSTLTIVGDGILDHYKTFGMPGEKTLPLVSMSDPDCLPREFYYQFGDHVVSRSLFVDAYSNVTPSFNDFMPLARRFKKSILFSSPVPSENFFYEQHPTLDVDLYLRCGALKLFLRNMSDLILTRLMASDLKGALFHFPWNQLDDNGCTKKCFLIEEPIQVHGNIDYWASRINESKILDFMA
jgi:hypothetical protein